MDLSENRGEGYSRHPWERARVRAVSKILRLLNGRGPVLDVGCGDAYLLRHLAEERGWSDCVGLDIHLTQKKIRQFGTSPRVTLTNDRKSLRSRSFAVIMMHDVLEHVEDDHAFVRGIVDDFLAPHGVVSFTAPAFQALFGPRDRELRHYRRYSRQQLSNLAERSGLEIVGSGYLFGSLLLLRSLETFAQRLGLHRASRNHGVSQWTAGEGLTRAIAHALSLDNELLLAVSRTGIKLPGLSVWTTCKIRP